MSWQVVLSIGVVLGIALYLSFLNPATIEVTLYKDVTREVPTVILILASMLVGALLVFFIELGRASKESVQRLKDVLQLKREKKLLETYNEGMNYLLGSRTQEAIHAFRKILGDFEIDGIWLDYHHSHASWERAVPNMPDTCFCQRCIAHFARETKTDPPEETPAQLAGLLLDKYKDQWMQWRCDVFTDWVREFRSILDETRPNALLGTFHCPWTDTELNGALRNKLAIDLKAQAEYVDVFSIMPYHARFGHAADPSWISRQTAWLGGYLGIKGEPGERHKIWPIVQLADWGETVSVDDVRSVLDHGTRLPATGVMVFHWGSLRKQMEKVDQMSGFYRDISVH